MDQKKMEKLISRLLVAEYNENLEEKKKIMEEVDELTAQKVLDLGVFVQNYIKEKQDLEALKQFNEIDFKKKLHEMEEESTQKESIENILETVNKLYFEDNKDIDGVVVQVHVVNLKDANDQDGNDEDCLEQLSQDLSDKMNKTIQFIKNQCEEYEVEDKVNRFVDSTKKILKDVADKSYDKALDLLDKTNDKFIQEMENTEVSISIELDLEAVELLIRALKNLKDNENGYDDIITFFEKSKEELEDKIVHHKKMIEKIQEFKKEQNELRELRNRK